MTLERVINPAGSTEERPHYSAADTLRQKSAGASSGSVPQPRSDALSLSFLLSCAQAFAIVMSAAFVLYVCGIIVPYLRHRPTWPGDPTLFQWHFFVPCRDEGLVIGDTIRYLRTRFSAAHVWVIDDHSDDHTLEVALWMQ